MALKEGKMFRCSVRIGMAFAVSLAVFPGWAQTGPTPPSEAPNSTTTNSNSAIDQAVTFGNYDAMRVGRKKMGGSEGKSLEELLAEDKSAADTLVADIRLPCVVSDALLVAQGEETAAGQSIKTKTYEVACDTGVGYFLVRRDRPGMSSAFTCFAAEAARAADVAAGRRPGPACALAANADIRAVAAAIIAKTGDACTVSGSGWLGQSDQNRADYYEVACDGGSGYVIASPLPGARLSLAVSRCPDSAKRGVPCKLSSNGNVLTAQAVKRALAEHQIVCQPAEMRLVGKESINKRRVVELSCPQQHPGGLVVLMPFDADAVAPFEAIDCSQAATRGIVCKFSQTK